MGEPARKFSEIEPDIRPNLRGIDGGGQSTPGRASLKAVNSQESNPQKPNNTSDVKSAEETPDKGYVNNYTGSNAASSKSGGFMAGVKKKSPIIAIIITLVAGGIGIGGLVSPGLLLVHIKETLSDNLNDSSAALSIRTNKVLHTKMNSIKSGFKFSSTGKCNVACKFGTINETMLNNLRAKGFTVTTESGKGLLKNRHVITSLTFPGETEPIKSGKAFDEALKKPGNAVKFKKVFNSKTAYFLNSKFGKIISEKFHLDKLSKLSSKIKEAVKGKLTTAKSRVIASLRQHLGIQDFVARFLPSNATRPDAMAMLRSNPVMAPAVRVLEGPVFNTAKKATSILGYVCTAYNLGKATTFATKSAKILAFTGFAMMFLNAADQIKAGDADPDVISQLGDQLTQIDTNGKSATDSLGYRTAAYGDTGTLTEEDRLYSAQPSGATIGQIGTLMSVVAMGGLLAINVVQKFCKFANNAIASIVATCSPEIAAAVAGAIPTGGGSAIGAIGVCAGKSVGIMTALSLGVGAFVSWVVQSVANNDVPSLDENTKGAALGDVLYTGTAQTLGGTSSAYGLKAGNQAEIKQYAIDTASQKKQDETIARYEAKDTPFDIYNQYSFLGSIVDTIDLGAIYNSSSPVSYMGNMLSIIPRSLAVLSNNVAAEADSKAAVYADGQCSDDGLNSIGINADAFCNPSYVMSSAELDTSIEEATKYMIDNGYIDEETGEVIPNTVDVDLFATSMVDINKDAILAGDLGSAFSQNVIVQKKNNYMEYLDNCANRTAPLGETSGAIEDVDYDWQIGLRCKDDNDMMKYFRVYTMDKAVNDTMDEDLSGSGSSSDSDGSVDPGDSSQPANTKKDGPGWTLKTNTDYSSAPCADGTTDLGVFKTGKGNITIRACQMPDKLTKVSSLISKRTLNMINAAAKDDIKLKALGERSSWRTIADQTFLRALYCKPICSRPVAQPGYSEHEKGIAIDFENISKIGSGKTWDWMKAHAKDYGFINFPAEGWHWSMSGG